MFKQALGGRKDGGILLAYQLTGRYGIGQKGEVPLLTVKVYGGMEVYHLGAS